jgi:hypothetical protein
MKILVPMVACAVMLGMAILHAQEDNLPAPPPPEPTPAPNAAAPAAPNADDAVSFQTFYDALASQGTWIQSPDYGYVWQPGVTDPNWAPYTVGHWVYSADGWTWASDEPWGWATYHYGRWVNLDGTGWVWVPGYTWAPAWVSWRYGDGYAGWAPLPPDSLMGIDYSDDGSYVDSGYHIGGDVDDYYGIGAGWYVFLPWGYLGYPNYRDHYCHRGDNFSIINRTSNVTNINVARSAGAGGREGGSFRRVTTGGPQLAQVDSVSTTPVTRVSLVHANQPNGGGTLSNNSLALFAPHVRAGANSTPSQVSGSIGQAVINRGTDIMRPTAVNGRLAPSAASAAEIQQARLAQSQAPATAKILMPSTQVKPVIQAPLGSLTPMARRAAGVQTGSDNGETIGNTAHGFSGQGATPSTHYFPGMTPGGTSAHSFQPGPVNPSTVPSTHFHTGTAETGVTPTPRATAPTTSVVPTPSIPTSSGGGNFRSSGSSPAGAGGSAVPSGGGGIAPGGGGGFGPRSAH